MQAHGQRGRRRRRRLQARLEAQAYAAILTAAAVLVGSGDREKPLIGQYPYVSNVTNRFYVLVDDVADPTASPALVNLDDVGTMRDFSAATSCGTAGVLPGSAWRGWFLDLPGRGEQTVTSAVAVSGMVTFSTNRPTTGSANTCDGNTCHRSQIPSTRRALACSMGSWAGSPP